MPKVSVIIPVYNLEKYIREAIRSVLDQTFQDFEIIVIDDGSTDRTPEIIGEMAQADNRIIVIHQKNSGKPGAVRNVGILRASGELITFLDGDDFYFSERLSIMVEVFSKHSNINLVFHEMEVRNEERGIQYGYLKKRHFLSRATSYVDEMVSPDVFILSKKYYCFMSVHIAGVVTSAVMIRERALGGGRNLFNEDMVFGEDIDLWYRLVKNNKIIFINKILGAYRFHDSNSTNQTEKFHLGFIDAHSRNYHRGMFLLSFKEKTIMRRQIAEEYGHLAYFYFQKYKINEARLMYFNSLVWWPFIFRNWLGFMKTFVSKFIVQGYRGSLKK